MSRKSSGSAETPGTTPKKPRGIAAPACAGRARNGRHSAATHAAISTKRCVRNLLGIKIGEKIARGVSDAIGRLTALSTLRKRRFSSSRPPIAAVASSFAPIAARRRRVATLDARAAPEVFEPSPEVGDRGKQRGRGFSAVQVVELERVGVEVVELVLRLAQLAALVERAAGLGLPAVLDVVVS